MLAFINTLLEAYGELRDIPPETLLGMAKLAKQMMAMKPSSLVSARL